MRLIVLGNTNLHPLVRAIRRDGSGIGLSFEVLAIEYEQYAQAILDSSSELYLFGAEHVLAAFEPERLVPELYTALPYLKGGEAVDGLIQAAVDRLVDLLSRLQTNFSGGIWISGFLPPQHSPLGAADAARPVGVWSAIRMLNAKLQREVAALTSVRVLDLEIACFSLPPAVRSPGKMRYLAGEDFSRGVLQVLSGLFTRSLDVGRRAPKKVLVTDLDNTIWGGVLTEDGVTNLSLGPEGYGLVYKRLQQSMLDLRSRGVILAIASKNDEAEALDALRTHPHCLLRPSLFSAWEINWNDKAENIVKIAERLGIGLDSVVFLDDNPAERERVRTALKSVLVLDFPEDPSHLPEFLRSLTCFDQLRLTESDLERAELYRLVGSAEEVRKSASSLEEFLTDLQMEIALRFCTAQDLARASQLTMKTNQFNMTTIRRTEDQLRALVHSPETEVLLVRLCDRFGDHGLVGLLVLRFEGPMCEVDTMLLSCRVLERRVEHALVHAAARRAKTRGATLLLASWVRTAKNLRYRLALSQAGMGVVYEADERVDFTLDLTIADLTPSPFHRIIEDCTDEQSPVGDML